MNAARLDRIEVTTICNVDCFYCAGRDMARREIPVACAGCRELRSLLPVSV